MVSELEWPLQAEETSSITEELKAEKNLLFQVSLSK
jgi:hypothetical protein